MTPSWKRKPKKATKFQSLREEGKRAWAQTQYNWTLTTIETMKTTPNIIVWDLQDNEERKKVDAPKSPLLIPLPSITNDLRRNILKGTLKIV